MRLVLIIGAGICCIPGLYCSLGIPYDIMMLGIPDRAAEIALPFYAIYVIMAFAPAILLFKSRKKEMPLSKTVAIGVMECLVVLGLLFGIFCYFAGV